MAVRVWAMRVIASLDKTAVFVLTSLQQVEPVAGEGFVLVVCHTRELAFQIRNEYNRFSKYMPDVSASLLFTIIADRVRHAGAVGYRPDSNKLPGEALDDLELGTWTWETQLCWIPDSQRICWKRCR